MKSKTAKSKEIDTCWIGVLIPGKDDIAEGATVTMNHWIGEKRAEHTMYYLYYGPEDVMIEIVKDKGEDWKTFVSIPKGSLPPVFRQENVHGAGSVDDDKQKIAFVEALKGARKIPKEAALQKRT